MFTTPTDFPRHLGRARAALANATEALAEAENDGASSDEILGLCEQVLARRLRLHNDLVTAGWEPTIAVAARMSRDRALLRQPAALTHDD